MSADIASWNLKPILEISTPVWSADQKLVLDDIAAMRDPCGDDMYAEVSRPIYLGGDPGTGKSEVLVHAAIDAADSGAKVLLMCPTGTRTPIVNVCLLTKTLPSKLFILLWS